MRTFLTAVVLAGLASAPAAAQSSAIEAIARTCNACHGVGGASAGTSMPSIGGLPRDYLARVMKQWKYGERSAITMNRVVKGFSDDELDALALYFSKQPWVPAAQPLAADIRKSGGVAVADNCSDCHGASGGDPDVDAPKLNGQWAKYMELELEKYRSAEFKMPHRRMKKAVQETQAPHGAAAAQYFGAQKN